MAKTASMSSFLSTKPFHQCILCWKQLGEMKYDHERQKIMKWRANVKITCPQCLKNGITDNRENYIDHNGVSCYLQIKWQIPLVGKSKQEIKQVYKERFEKFSSEVKKKWLSNVEIKDVDRIQHAKQEAEAYLERFQERGTHWKTNQWKNVYRGILAEECIATMLNDMKIEAKHATFKDASPYDILIRPCGTFEVKSSPIGQNHVNIKKIAWQNEPCLFLIALKTINIEQPTFKLLGYMKGLDVYKLKVYEGIHFGLDYYRAEPKNLKTPEQLLNMLLKHSSEKPSWM